MSIKIINQSSRQKEELPQGKLSMYWVNTRATNQIYCAGKYVSCASDACIDTAIRNLLYSYKVSLSRVKALLKEGVKYR